MKIFFPCVLLITAIIFYTQAVMADTIATEGEASPSDTKFQGKTIAQGKLRTQVMALAVPYAQMQSKCGNAIELMETEIFSIPKKPVVSNGVAVYGEIIERWVATLCEKKQTLFVTYSFTPEGKTNYAVSGEPQREGFMQSLPTIK